MLLTLLLVVLILVALGLVAVVLLQQSEGGALGMGGGPSGFMTARGAGDLLTRTTWILAGAFFVLCILLTVVSGHIRGGSSVVDRLKVDPLNPAALAPPKPVVPATPASAAGPAPLEAPRPQVNVAPAASAPAASPIFGEPAPPLTAKGRTAPPTTTDSGAISPVSRPLGIQTAPQVQPTTPAQPTLQPPAAASNTAQ